MVGSAMVQRSPQDRGTSKISRPEAVKAKKAGLFDTLYETNCSRSVVIKRDVWGVHCCVMVSLHRRRGGGLTSLN